MKLAYDCKLTILVLHSTCIAWKLYNVYQTLLEYIALSTKQSLCKNWQALFSPNSIFSEKYASLSNLQVKQNLLMYDYLLWIIIEIISSEDKVLEHN